MASLNRRRLQELARTRLKEARILKNQGCYPGAYYLLGYSVECAIKACIAKGTQKYDFPDKSQAQNVHTHDLKKLVGIAGLERERRNLSQNDPDFDANWAVVKDWAATSRYILPDKHQANDLYKAVTQRNSGILTWLRQHW